MIRRYAPMAAALVVASCYVADSGPPDEGSSQVQGFPCDVADVVSRRCLGCHNPTSGRLSFTSPDAFVAKRETVLARLRDPAMPMPPSGQLGQAELLTVENWLNAGAPKGECNNPELDGGVKEIDGGIPGEGLPCDVEGLLATQCRGCHGSKLIGNAPMPLLTREQLLAPSSVGDLSVAALSVKRMKDAANPMPPSGVRPASEVAVLEGWVHAGMPVGRCTVPDAGPSLFDVPAQCTSTTTTGNTENRFMYPGRACISCHAQENARKGREETPAGIAGTVYPTAHEPDRCNGTNLPATVVITDSANHVYRLSTTTNGNFHMYAQGSGFTPPYRARVETANGTREMLTPQTSGDCNSCHTQTGAHGAPGRIILP